MMIKMQRKIWLNIAAAKLNEALNALVKIKYG